MSKNILLIGVGGTGSRSVDLLYQKVAELGNQTGNRIEAIVFDTDMGDIQGITSATTIPLADNRSLGEVIKVIGPELIDDWFPSHTGAEAQQLGMEDGSTYLNQEMHRGASQWRKKSYLAFVNLMNNTEKRNKFRRAIEKLVRAGGEGGIYEIYTVASLAGGTGSGSFIPITLYAKKYIRSFGVEVRTHALLACPDIYEPSLAANKDQVTKVYSNAYAILRELNAMNQVVFGNNRPQPEGVEKKAPIHFRLGNVNDNNTGVLFDCDDENYWDPSAIPFNKVYLLDKLVGLSSVKAHDSIMSNALYTLLCTDIGVSFDTTDSNLEADRSKAANHNAVYAGISAAELRYPLSDVVSYMSYKKAEEAAEGEWTTIYRDVEEAIEAKRQSAVEMGRPFVLKDGEYAEEVQNAATNFMRDNITAPMTYLLKRGLYNVVMRNDIPEEEEFLTPYLRDLSDTLRAKLACDAAEALKAIGVNNMCKELGLLASGDAKQAERNKFLSLAKNVQSLLTGYYVNAIKVIRNETRSINNTILPMDPERDIFANKANSLVYNLLTKNGKFIHPVAAYVQLSRLKLKLKEMNNNITPWEDLKGHDEVYAIPEHLLVCSDAVPAPDAAGKVAKVKDSKYAEAGEDRLKKFVKMSGDGYAKLRSSAYADSAVLVQDAQTLSDSLFKSAEEQLSFRVLSKVEEQVDMLIQQYRAFFRSFEEGRRELSRNTRRELVSNEGAEDVTYIAASADDKNATFAEYKKNENVSDDDLAELDNVAGSSVFEASHKRCMEEISGKELSEDASVGGLFTGLVSAYKDQILKSRFYKDQMKKGIFQVMVEDMRKKGYDNDRIYSEVGTILRTMHEKAQPSLKVKGAVENEVLLVSKTSAKYLYDNAKEMGITSYDNDVKTYVEIFLQNAGLNGVSVAVVADAHPHMLSVTRKIDNVQPTDIDKINEKGKDPKYFRMYQVAIRNKYAENTDMWNPHLGMELHKHGYLPYINADYEKDYNEKLAKALLFAIMDGKFYYQQLPRSTQRAFYHMHQGKLEIVRDKNEIVTERNIKDLLSWLRMQEELVEDYSQKFDAEVKKVGDALPMASTAAARTELMRKITVSEFVTRMRENIFDKVSGIGENSKMSLSLLEFAYLLKNNEEAAGADCDDAEKVLEVGYNALRKIWLYRVANDLEGRVNLQYQQTGKFVTAFHDSKNLPSGENPLDYTKMVFGWANSIGCFLEPKSIGPDVDIESFEKMLKEARGWGGKSEDKSDDKEDVKSDTPTDSPVGE